MGSLGLVSRFQTTPPPIPGSFQLLGNCTRFLATIHFLLFLHPHLTWRIISLTYSSEHISPVQRENESCHLSHINSRVICFTKLCSFSSWSLHLQWESRSDSPLPLEHLLSSTLNLHLSASGIFTFIPCLEWPSFLMCVLTVLSAYLQTYFVILFELLFSFLFIIFTECLACPRPCAKY